VTEHRQRRGITSSAIVTNFTVPITRENVMSSLEHFACDMSALSAEQRAEHARLLNNVFGKVQSVRAIPDGYALRMVAERLPDAAAFVALERRCCPFFDFALTLKGRADSCELQITGPDGVRPFIEAEFERALPAAVRFPQER
jgi:hypothetical protein